MTNDAPGAPSPLPQGPEPAGTTPTPISFSDERVWAMLAHLSVLVNLVTAFLGLVVPFAIYVVFKDRSRYIAYHALQAFFFQLIWWLGGSILAAVLWIASSALAVIVVGLLLTPLAVMASLLPLASLVYGVIGALRCSQGRDFRYWLVGDWVRGTLEGQARSE